jgi:membrane-associated phospholipid phosphatase
MHRYKKWGMRVFSDKWFLSGMIFAGLFLALTAVYATGVLNVTTILLERWIIGRPLTQFDCVLIEWKDFGSAPLNLLFIAFLGVACGFTRYRWRVLPCLMFLVLVGLGAEEFGKDLFSLSYPPAVRSGMLTLSCPQAGNSLHLHLQLALGMWWKAPSPSLSLQSLAHTVSQLPINTNASYFTQSQSYPSGHAIRWWFAGLLLAWLVWRHVKRGGVRWFFVVLILFLSFLGAAIQLYIGNHFFFDTVAGYLLGSSLACFAISVLIFNERQRERPNALAQREESAYLAEKGT